MKDIVNTEWDSEYMNERVNIMKVKVNLMKVKVNIISE